MDFTVKKYKELLLALRKGGYEFVSFKDYVLSHEHSLVPAMVGENSETYEDAAEETDTEKTSEDMSPEEEQKRLILRHDVDRLPDNSLKLAQIEHDLGITGTYYFRIVPESYELSVMHAIAKLGHEIGYHYEDVDLATQEPQLKNKKVSEGDVIGLAYESFCRNLETLRKDFDVTTLCMHGSPRSRYDNRLIWKKYNYRDLGIIGEPYFDVDYDRVAYFTDTGRRWNGEKVSVRDKVHSPYDFNFRTTSQFIKYIGSFPNEVMFTIHPQRWTDKKVPWAWELFWQNFKNVIKRLIVSLSPR